MSVRESSLASLVRLEIQTFTFCFCAVQRFSAVLLHDGLPAADST